VSYSESFPLRIYLDNAATSWPKPEAVYRAVDRAQREWGVAAGRGVSREAGEIARMLQTTRAAIAGIIHGGAAERIAFCQNGTAACNTALLGMLQSGDHVITTQTEHNSILRPLRFLEQERGVTVTIVPCDATGWCDPAAFAAAWQPRTKLVALNHASNVTGTLQDAAAIGAICRERGGFFLLDAAQSLGHVPIDVAALHVDLLAAPGHKGLLGPLGTGLLYVGERAEPLLQPLVRGGTGTASEKAEQPWPLPDRLESGNQNTPAIAGLLAGVQTVLEQGVAARLQHDAALTAQFIEQWNGRGLNSAGTILGPADSSQRVGIISLALHDFDPQELALILDQQEPRIQVRAGLHCAPLIHSAIGSAACGGTLRLSWGHTTTREEIIMTVEILSQILAS
jgi:cysteine desulfurase/selenocysteine lyase